MTGILFEKWLATILGNSVWPSLNKKVLDSVIPNYVKM